MARAVSGRAKPRNARFKASDQYRTAVNIER